MDAPLRLEGVSRRFGEVRAVDDVSLAVGSGILGLLGPNGAGKSTLTQIVATFLRPTAGVVRWRGTDAVARPRAIRSVLGYLPQEFGVYENLSAVEFLEYMAVLRGIGGPDGRRRIRELLERVGLEASADRRLGRFSGGMRRRVGIAQALVADPELLVVDEPATGLDPEERARFRGLLSELGGDRVVLISTHLVADVEATASEVAVMADGRLLARDTPQALIARVEGQVWEWTVDPADLERTRRRHRVSRAAPRSGGVLVRAVAEGRPATAAVPVEPTLEDAYLSVVTPGPA